MSSVPNGESSPLRSARIARGWSQARAIRELERRLRDAGALSTSTQSLKVYLSEWENGRRPIGARYKSALRAVFGLTDDELFPQVASAPSVATSDEYVALAARIESGLTVDRSLVATLTQQTELLRTMDRQMGAPSLVDNMSAHLATLDEALAYAVLPDARRPVAAALSGASTLAGWQALDVGAVDRAWRHYETARRSALDADDRLLLAHAMGEQAYVLIDLGKPQLAADLARSAIQAAGTAGPPRLTAWLNLALAEISAIGGAVDQAPRALDHALDVMPADHGTRQLEVPGLFLNEAHLLRWRGNVLALMGNSAAIDDLSAGLAGLDGTFTRAEAGLQTDLAYAYLARGDEHAAREHARRARTLASRTGSVRHRRRLDRLTLR